MYQSKFKELRLLTQKWNGIVGLYHIFAYWAKILTEIQRFIDRITSWLYQKWWYKICIKLFWKYLKNGNEFETVFFNQNGLSPGCAWFHLYLEAGNEASNLNTDVWGEKTACSKEMWSKTSAPCLLSTYIRFTEEESQAWLRNFRL